MELVIKHYRELTTDELHDIYRLSVAVFVVEQDCPYQEIDGNDKKAWHIWLQDSNVIQAYLRVLPPGVIFEDASIGRVVSIRRHEGLASILLKEGIRIAKEKFDADKITIEAQTYARSLYEKIGFRQSSDEFLEDGIPHIKMTLNMSDTEDSDNSLIGR